MAIQKINFYDYINQRLKKEGLLKLNTHQMNVLTDPHRFKTIVWHRKAGKTLMSVVEILKQAQMRIGTYWIIFPYLDEGRDTVWNGMLFKVIPEEMIEKKNENYMSVKFTNGSYLRLKGADHPDSLRGPNVVGVIFDEFAKQKLEAWHIVSPMITATKGWAWFVSTPIGKNHLYDYYNRGKSLSNSQWKSWYLRASESGIIEQSELEREYDEMGAEQFSQEYECFPKDTDIITRDGVKPIQDVKVGDSVLTHANRYHKVKRTFQKEYIGNLIKVESAGNRKPLLSTPEHPYRVLKNKVHEEYEWRKAQDLKVNPKVGHDNNADRITFPKPLQGKRTIISGYLARLIAWYIAEGSFSRNILSFALGTHEKDCQIEIIEAIKKETGKKASIIVNNGSTTITVNDCELGNLLISLCGSGAKNKKIPFPIISGYEFLVYDILIKGDGHRRSKEDSYTTISKTLAYQVQLLAHSLSYPASISENVKSEGIILGRKVNLNTQYTVYIYKNNSRKEGLKLKNHKYSISASVKQKEEIPFEGLVYNLEVEIDNSYTANGRVVHNCAWLEGAGQVFRGVDKILTASPQGPVSDHLYVIGVDIAKHQDWTVLTVFDRKNNMQVFQDRFQRLDWPLQRQRIAEISKLYNGAICVVDQTGIGDSMVDELGRAGIPVSGIQITRPMKMDLIGKMQRWIENRFFSIINMKETVDELGDYSYKKDITGKYTYNAPSGRHDDIVMSLALAVWELTPVMPQQQKPQEQTPLQTFKQRLLSDMSGENEYFENLAEWERL